MQKKIISFICCIAFLVTLTACGDGSAPIAKAFDKKAQTGMPSDSLIAQNSNYRLEWDEDTCGVILTDLATGLVYGTSPESGEGEQLDELGMPIKKHPQVNSVLTVKYMDYESNTESTVLSYNGAVKGGRVRCGKAGDALVAEFYFDSQGFMIPVSYELLEDSVRISIDSSKIEESQNQILQISLAPFWCSAENDSENTYLFIPSGSGALAGTASYSQQGITFSSEVYGRDLALNEIADVSTEKSVRLPVYGAKSADYKATLAVIESGADSALIESITGSTAFGYTAVYPTFRMRGYTNHTVKMFVWQEVENMIYSKRMIKDKLSVRFFPLSGDNADYNGMAHKYREYLEDSGKLKSNSDDSRLSLTFVGGTMTTKSFLGIPYKTLYPVTTLSQVTKTVKEISENTDIKLSVILKGFGESGIDVGKIAGGYKIGSAFGSVSDLKELIKLCEDKNAELYMDFDVVGFSDSANGFSTLFDSVFNSGNQRSVQYYYNKALRDQKSDNTYYLLRPSLLNDALTKLSEKTEKWDLTGIALNSLTSSSYSDYKDRTESKYYAKSGMSKLVSGSINNLKKNGTAIASFDANGYAAELSDIITGTPTYSSGDYSFSADIPFYEIVFKGSVPMTAESINLESDTQKAVLRAVESGTGISYTVSGSWDNKLINSDFKLFYNSKYDSIKGSIFENAERLSEYYKKISGAHISSHKILESGLRETVFDNGVTVFVNYGDAACASPAGEVPPHDFLVLEVRQ